MHSIEEIEVPQSSDKIQIVSNIFDFTAMNKPFHL